MGLAVTHVILTIIILDLFRHYVFGKKVFPRYLLVIGGIAGLAPDLDVPLGWILSIFAGRIIDLHGLFTHSLFWAILLLLIAIMLHSFIIQVEITDNCSQTQSSDYRFQ